MNFLSLIEAKREGKILAPEQIQSLVLDFTAGKIPDYQMAAMPLKWATGWSPFFPTEKSAALAVKLFPCFSKSNIARPCCCLPSAWPM